MNAQPIRFFHRGQLVEVRDVRPTLSVLDWLREEAHCSGTKEGCNEGDCGACTVVVGELDAKDRLQLHTVNACIQFLPTLHGKALFAIEDLKAINGGELHPTQQALVDCHGSQCGFCTPGFAMSLWSCYERHLGAGTRPSRQQLADELSGNLCRCTGYRPILDAGQRMFDLPPAPLETAPVVKALQGVKREGNFHYDAGAARGHGSDRYDAPSTVEELATLYAERPKARLLAGSTDIGLWVNKGFRALGDILYVGDVAELKTVEVQDGMLRIGGGAPLEAAWAALTQRCPELTEVWLRFASPPIRNGGTMGGNVANGSPIGDSPPVLMALDAEVELRRGERVRRMPLPALYLDYMKNALEPGEFVQAVLVPEAAFARQVRAYKISKRFDCDISALCAGLAIELDGEVVRSVRIAFGGMAGTVKRAAAAEAALVGQRWDEAALAAAQAAMATDYTPLTDLRASADYRIRVARNLLRRFWLETRPGGAALPEADTRVWSVMPHAPAASEPAAAPL